MGLAHDTHPDAHRVQIAAYRAMSPERRVEIAAELSDAIRQIARQGIRLRHPDYSEAQVARALVRLLFGNAVAGDLDPP